MLKYLEMVEKRLKEDYTILSYFILTWLYQDEWELAKAIVANSKKNIKHKHAR